MLKLQIKKEKKTQNKHNKLNYPPSTNTTNSYNKQIIIICNNEDYLSQSINI